jgi:hypothetical protein
LIDQTNLIYSGGVESAPPGFLRLAGHPVRVVCPEFPGHPQLIHWSIADPAGEADPRAAFRRVAAELRTRIGFLLARLGA